MLALTPNPWPLKPTTWYAIRDRPRASFDVLLMVGGEEVVGIYRRYKQPRAIPRRKIPIGLSALAEHEVRTTFVTEGWCVRVEEGRRVRYIELPVFAEPQGWRPIPGQRYPDPLPQPQTQMAEPNWRSDPVDPSTPETPDDWEWPGEYSQPPRISREEAEVRLIRGLRTERSRKSQAGSRNGGGGDMDSLLRLILRTQGRLEYEHKDKARAALPELGEMWEPTRRDHGDWSTAVGWHNTLDKAHQHVIRQRSYNPPYSFRLIGEGMGMSESGARKVYAGAMDEVVVVANRVR